MTTLAPPNSATLDAEVLADRPLQRNRGDRAFFRIVTGGVLFVPALVILFLGVLLTGAWPAIDTFGWSFLRRSTWNDNAMIDVPESQAVQVFTRPDGKKIYTAELRLHGYETKIFNSTEVRRWVDKEGAPVDPKELAGLPAPKTMLMKDIPLEEVQAEVGLRRYQDYGAWPLIYGTLASSILALLLAGPIGIGVAAFLSEVETSTWKHSFCLLVAIPIVALMAPVVTMTELRGRGGFMMDLLLFVVIGAILNRKLPERTRLWAIAGLGLPILLLSAALVSGAWGETAATVRIGGITLFAWAHIHFHAATAYDLLGIIVAVLGAMWVIKRARSVLPFLLEILATIPSVVYGMWGMFVLAPWVAEHLQPLLGSMQPAVNSIFGMRPDEAGQLVPRFPLFVGGDATGLSLGTAVLVLSVMILPMIVSISLDSMRAVPRSYREAALGLGATRWEMIRMAVLPPAKSGIFGACILALGRALGETMAVTMVIGNAVEVNTSLFGKSYSISSIIANQYGEAAGLKYAALTELALILFATTLAVNLLARLLVRKSASTGAKRFSPMKFVLKYTGIRALFVGLGSAWENAIDGALRLCRISNTAYRRFKNRVAIGGMGAMAVICVIPLGALLYALVREGGRSVSAGFLFALPRPVGEPGGGIGNAILGTVLLLICGAFFAVPLGVALGIYLTQRATTKLAAFTRLLLDVLSGIPAIIVGVFIYAVVVNKSGFSLRLSFSTIAGGLAYAMIMLPIFARATEEALKAIPRTVDEAGLGLGLPRRTVIVRILVRAAMPAILTGLFLALARVGGEAAPLLMTTQGSEFWPSHSIVDLLTFKPVREPVNSLPFLIFRYSTSPFEELKRQAWGASLVLVFLVLSIRLLTRGYTAWKYGGKEAHV